MTKPKPSSNEQNPRTFETDLSALEEVVTKLEREDLPLEQLIDEFEKGVGLLRNCREYLKNAKGRIEQFVVECDGQWVLKEYESK